jgi:hypothetical protein
MIFGYLFNDKIDLIPDVNCGVRRLQFFGYGPSDLPLSYLFEDFPMVPTRSIMLAIFLASTSLIMVIRTLNTPATLIRLLGWFFLAYWSWYSYRGCFTTLIAAHMHIVLALQLKLKL